MTKPKNMRNLFLITLAVTMIQITGCRSSDAQNSRDLFDKENLVAWCIVPFDSAERGPEARAQMLDELGTMSVVDEEGQSLRDKANLTLAYDYLNKQEPEKRGSERQFP